jgi:hypothetical protein
MNTLTLAATNMQMSTADWFLMALGLLVFAALLLWLVSALHLLDRRLARGEITVEQREQARRILAGEREEASADVLA